MRILNTKDGNKSSKYLFLTEFVTSSTAREKRVIEMFIISPGSNSGGRFQFKKAFEFSEAYSEIWPAQLTNYSARIN